MAPLAPLFYALLPLAVIELVLASRGKGITIYHVAFPFAGLR